MTIDNNIDNMLDGLVAIGCEGLGTANGISQPRMELAERSHEHTYLIDMYLFGPGLLMEQRCFKISVNMVVNE